MKDTMKRRDEKKSIVTEIGGKLRKVKLKLEVSYSIFDTGLYEVAGIR